MKPRRKSSVPVFPDQKHRMCTSKRRYRTQADALDAALVAGVQRERVAYLCPLCGHWHLSTARRD